MTSAAPAPQKPGGSAWTATVDLSYSSADRQESILETYSGLRNNGSDTVLVELGDDDDFPTFSFGRDYTDPTQIVLTDPGGWGQDGYLKTPEIEDELTSYRIDLARSFMDGPFSSVEFGLNYSDREKQRSVPEFFLDLITDQTGAAGEVQALVDQPGADARAARLRFDEQQA